MERQVADDPAVDEEVAFWRGFIAWWAREKAAPVPARAREALKRAQRRAEPAQVANTRWRRTP